MHITRLKLAGFKSFVEPTELVIEPGLTGVVGPNGCGKSNLLEALRWVMGETSYKNMRGGAMEDVIFSGTQGRPARNFAEVGLVLDNSAHTAPAAFNAEDTLEVTRRIERDAGSSYKINNGDVRARDVQLLFADASTGARSPALVQQGRIGEIVNAKPQARRRILEEAAGITGLHSRRHEAELRLKAAETNLERLQDIMGQLQSQLNSLKRQARQAVQYKEISNQIQKLEAVYYHLNWLKAGEMVDEEEQALQEAMQRVGVQTQAETNAIVALEKIAEQLPPLRDEEAKASAILQRLKIAQESLEEEEERAKTRLEEQQATLTQWHADLARENTLIEEAKSMMSTLAGEQGDIEKNAQTHTETIAAAREKANQSAAQLADEEQSLSVLTSETAELRSERAQIEKQLTGQQGLITRFEQQAFEAMNQIEEIKAKRTAQSDIDTLAQETEKLDQALAKAEQDMLQAEKTQQDKAGEEKQLREKVQYARLQQGQLETEIATLKKLLTVSSDTPWPPVIDQLAVSPGFELALGAALGDDLDAPLDPQAPMHWADLPDLDISQSLPEHIAPLSAYVSGANALRRRLTYIGVTTREAAERLHSKLAPGQRLVTKEGDLWRWDGFYAKADAPTPAAQRLRERNRLRQLEEDFANSAEILEEFEFEHEALNNALITAQEQEKAHRSRWRELQTTMVQAREAVAKAEKANQHVNEKIAGLGEALLQIKERLSEANQEQENCRQALTQLRPITELETRLEEKKTQVQELRTIYNNTHSSLTSLEREEQLRKDRLDKIIADQQRWQSRSEQANEQILSLNERIAVLNDDLAKLKEIPREFEQKRQKLLSEISTAEERRQQAANKLENAETDKQGQEQQLRQIQQDLTSCKEERARVEARLENAREKRAENAHLIRENLNCAPEECLKLAELGEDEPLPELGDVEKNLTRLKANRERLGGVNLRAEEEATTLKTQFDTMESEKGDLEQAIQKLRQEISNLNREGRKRLMEAFEHVNIHFQRLFKVLFGGGEAELQLIESDDPLQAGLEILARPPGKKPQVLTLLSGGEKALTALSLIFAVFLTNPSPICVLDEVDAPLDDANVERFCRMMEDMASNTDTRFLVITHHPMTMARMNRLFGVTMAEKGVSQLVSVDLSTAESYREAS